MAPISELRGAIPTGIGLGLSWPIVFILSVVFNALVFFPIYFGLEYVYDALNGYNWFRKWVEKARKKGHKALENYGYLGLIPFVAIPLPITGAWTATLVAWLFDLTWWKALLPIALGVIIAGVIVLLSSFGLVSLLI